MKCMAINKQTIYYSSITGKVEIMEGTGDSAKHTGQFTETYSTPTAIRASVSPATGKTVREQFGSILNYDKVILTDDVNIGITESSRIWIDTVPTITDDIWSAHDYVVTGISKSRNFVQIAVAKVKVSA